MGDTPAVIKKDTRVDKQKTKVPSNGGTSELIREPTPGDRAISMGKKIVDIAPKGNAYGTKLYERKTDRLSFSITIGAVSANRTSIKGKTKIGGAEASAQLFDSKIDPFGKSMTVALGKVAVDYGTKKVPGFDDIKITFALKAFEAKLEEGKVDVDAFKLSASLNGVTTFEGVKLKVAGTVTLKIDPSDVRRLIRMAKISKKIIQNTKEAIKARKKIDALNKAQKRLKKLQKLQKRRGSKIASKARKKLQASIRKNANKIKKLTRSLIKNKNATLALKTVLISTTKGLKSKAGRLMGMAVVKVGGKVLLKLIPGVNIVMTAIDIIEISTSIYKLLTGKAEFGLGSGEETSGEEGSEETENKESNEIEGGDEQESNGNSEVGEQTESSGEIDISENEAYEPSMDNIKLDLHTKASLVKDALKSEDNNALKISNTDWMDLNDIVPKDFTDEEMEALLAWIKVHISKKSKQDIFDLMGAIEEHIGKIKQPSPIITIDGKVVKNKKDILHKNQKKTLVEKKKKPLKEKNSKESDIKFLTYYVAKQVLIPNSKGTFVIDANKVALLKKEGLFIRGVRFKILDLLVKNNNLSNEDNQLLVVGLRLEVQSVEPKEKANYKIKEVLTHTIRAIWNSKNKQMKELFSMNFEKFLTFNKNKVSLRSEFIGTIQTIFSIKGKLKVYSSKGVYHLMFIPLEDGGLMVMKNKRIDVKKGKEILLKSGKIKNNK